MELQQQRHANNTIRKEQLENSAAKKTAQRISEVSAKARHNSVNAELLRIAHAHGMSEQTLKLVEEDLLGRHRHQSSSSSTTTITTTETETTTSTPATTHRHDNNDAADISMVSTDGDAHGVLFTPLHVRTSSKSADSTPQPTRLESPMSVGSFTTPRRDDAINVDELLLENHRLHM